MSTEVDRPIAAAPLTRFPWQGIDSSADRAVRPLITGDADAYPRHEGTRDLVLPSVLAERVGVAQREGYDRGFAEGELAGHQAARGQIDAHLSRLASTIDQLATLRSAMLRQSERDIVRLAIAIAERILRQEVRVNRQALATMARAAAQKLGDHSVVTVQLNADDLRALTEGGGGTTDDSPVRLVADPAIPAGGCVVHSTFGTIDISLDAQIREIERDLLGGETSFDPSGGTGVAG